MAQSPFAFPIMLDVRARRVVVAGGGREPAHKAAVLAKLGALVLVWAAEHRETALLEGQPRIELRSGSFDARVLDGALLAIIARRNATPRALERFIRLPPDGRIASSNPPPVGKGMAACRSSHPDPDVLDAGEIPR